jgi:hypothetical protein
VGVHRYSQSPSEVYSAEATQVWLCGSLSISEPLRSGIYMAFYQTYSLDASLARTAIDYIIGLFGGSLTMKQTLNK